MASLNRLLRSPLVQKGQSNWVDQSATRITVMDGWCSYRNVQFRFEQTVYNIREMRLRSSDPESLANGRGFPQQTEFAIRDLLHFTDIPDLPWLTYALRAKAKRRAINAAGTIIWDATQNSLDIETLRLDFAGENSIELSLKTAITAPASLWQGSLPLRIHGFSMSMVTHGLFESSLPIVMANISTQTDPTDAVTSAMVAIEIWLAGQPTQSMSDDSKAALSRFVQDFPNPTGTFGISATFPEGLTAEQAGSSLSGMTLADINFDALTVTYEQEPFDPGESDRPSNGSRN